MTDTAQPATAAETEVVSREDALADAANAFKVSLGQAEAPERPRDEAGRFASSEPAEEQEIEAEATAEAESHDAEHDDDEAAEEAQPTAADMPHSWPAEQAETWKALPPETQALIAEREGQRDAAVNAKFQEAANARRAAEATIAEAQNNRQNALQTLDLAMQVLQPQEPPISMLDMNSSDYDPDSYHLAKAQYERSLQYLNSLANQRQQLVAQAQQEEQRQALLRTQQINQLTAPAFLRDVPEAADPQKLGPLINELAQYAIQSGVPQDMFDGTETALEWHFIWKAREYDKLQAAKAKVKTDPKPEQRKASPAVRPGVATPPSAQKAARKQQAFDRLARSGSVEDGAAAFKHILSGTR
jgi:hypothetical protein